jgi:hypothetical protein
MGALGWQRQSKRFASRSAGAARCSGRRRSKPVGSSGERRIGSIWFNKKFGDLDGAFIAAAWEGNADFVRQAALPLRTDAFEL